jgi:hypothetical protein
MADTLTLKEVELDYEADEGDEGRGETPTPTPTPSSPRARASSPLGEGELPSSPVVKQEEEQGEVVEEGGLESGEELEDGEIR